MRSLSIFFLTLFGPTIVHAAGYGISNPLSGSHINTICDLINAIITIITEIGAIVAVMFIIWTGFLFVIARGNVEKIKKAKSIFITTIIGTALLVGSSVIAKVIINTVYGVASSVNSTSTTSSASICTKK